MGGQVGQGRLATGAGAERLTRGLEFAPDAADATRPGVAPERVDHGAANAAFGEGLEADAAFFVVAVHGIDEADHPVLHEVADVHARRHRSGHPARKRFHERPAGDHATLLVFTKGLQHVSLLSLARRLGVGGTGLHRCRSSLEQPWCQRDDGRQTVDRDARLNCLFRNDL